MGAPRSAKVGPFESVVTSGATVLAVVSPLRSGLQRNVRGLDDALGNNARTPKELPRSVFNPNSGSTNHHFAASRCLHRFADFFHNVAIRCFMLFQPVDGERSNVVLWKVFLPPGFGNISRKASQRSRIQNVLQHFVICFEQHHPKKLVCDITQKKAGCDSLLGYFQGRLGEPQHIAGNAVVGKLQEITVEVATSRPRVLSKSHPFFGSIKFPRSLGSLTKRRQQTFGLPDRIHGVNSDTNLI